MKLYICIYNKVTKEVQFAEDWPMDTEDEKYFCRVRSESLDLQARSMGEDWTHYFSKEKQFEWPIEVPQV